MTLLSPTLSIRQLSVFKDGRIVLSVPFHKGLNIVRGHNSSGKTTTLDFIAFNLGTEVIPWKKEALLCDYSLLEILLNDQPVTLRRDVSEKDQQPLAIFWGPLSKALEAPITSWEIYPFRRSTNKLSFTQSILLALGMPEAQGDGSSNLTMHQFMRVMYADQPSLHSPIFRIDAFDNALTRETVGSYLCGVYDDKLYSAQLARRGLEKEIGQAESELKSIFSVIAKSGQDVNIEFFGQQIIQAESRRGELFEELARLKNERTVQRDKKKSGDEGVLRSALDSAKNELARNVDAIAKTESELEDSKRFVEELESRLKSLDESESARNYFGTLAFSFCPCCLAEIRQSSDSDKTCSLCKTPLHGPSGETQILRMRNELRIQLKESLSLIASREAEVTKIRSLVPGLRQNLRGLEQRYTEATTNWSSEIETALEKASRELGSLDHEIKSLYENQRLASVIKDLQIRRDKLLEHMRSLDSEIESLAFSQDARKSEVTAAIASNLSRLLKLDFHRQEEFKTADRIQFSFIDNQIVVDGSARFAESSTVVLRHLFHLALLTTSTQIASMRLPRFLMLDGIEDGGIELPRAHRLQEIIAEECSSYEAEYQLIMATSQISPALDQDKYVVGREFTEDHRSLDIR